MSQARILADLDEIVTAAALLIERRLSYEDALESHFHRLLAAFDGDRRKLSTLDNIHDRYT